MIRRSASRLSVKKKRYSSPVSTSDDDSLTEDEEGDDDVCEPPSPSKPDYAALVRKSVELLH